ncbi:hypothetical protein [Pedobacter sp. HMWF019]|uniref:hypothetical protein n=1 Tax=Pedobacter sp. HMWF019 TaxID=2056856 RepID=UPI0018EEA315|nr:hypothetical protein [Pedobacter sp. HMWF019]
MQINYWWIGAVAVIMVVLIIWLIKRNRKDEKVYEKEIIESELKSEDHREEE